MVICVELGALITASSGVEAKPITIEVSAASSLNEAFTDIAREFDAPIRAQRLN
jgi:ABC-type molybdate transport system substrate-binding protein